MTVRSGGYTGANVVAWILPVLLALVLLGCGGAEDPYGKWQLSSLNGQPVLSQRPLTLELGDSSYRGYDGSNTFWGDYVYGTLEAGQDGTFFLRLNTMTLVGYPTPEDEERAESYRKSLEIGTKYRVVNGQLEVPGLDDQTLLVFVREGTLH